MGSVRSKAAAVVVALVTAVSALLPGASAPALVRERTDAPRPGLADPVACPGCWTPRLRTSWQWQLGGKVDTTIDVQMFDIDGFEASRSLVHSLHAKGARVVCYISAGSWENWRPDADRFPGAVLGRSNGWPGERWLDIRRLDVLGPIMKSRLDRCERKHFDGVEFDNVDGYRNHTGFPLTGADQLRYDVFLANQAHRRGLTAFLKNDLGQIDTLLPYFDAALNEQCFQYSECGALKAFVEAGKPVFGVEYKLETGAFCDRANRMNFNFLKKRLALGVWRVPCRGV
jgi:hypothetical protein